MLEKYKKKPTQTFNSETVSVSRQYSIKYNELRVAIEKTFENFNTELKVPKLRVFFNNGQREDLKFEFLSKQKCKNQNISEWVSQITGQNDNFCLVVNGISAWSELLHNYIVEHIVEPWINVRGRNFKPFDAYTFLGKYSTTPFGIHTDEEDSILLHLGPNKKIVYYWPDFEFNNSKWESLLQVNRFDLNSFPSKPVELTLWPGDLIRIPKGHPHMMTNQEYSVTLGVIPNPSTCTDTFSGIIQELSKHELKDKMHDGYRSHNEAMLGLKDHIELISQTYKLNQTFEVQQRRLKSNGWLVPSPDLSYIEQDELKDIFFQSDNLNPLDFVVVSDKIRVFIRGREIKLPHNHLLISALENITQGLKLNLTSFENSLKPDFDLMASRDIFETLVNLGGLIVCNLE